MLIKMLSAGARKHLSIYVLTKNLSHKSKIPHLVAGK